MELTWTAA